MNCLYRASIGASISIIFMGWTLLLWHFDAQLFPSSVNDFIATILVVPIMGFVIGVIIDPLTIEKLIKPEHLYSLGTKLLLGIILSWCVVFPAALVLFEPYGVHMPVREIVDAAKWFVIPILSFSIVFIILNVAISSGRK